MGKSSLHGTGAGELEGKLSTRQAAVDIGTKDSCKRFKAAARYRIESQTQCSARSDSGSEIRAGLVKRRDITASGEGGEEQVH